LRKIAAAGGAPQTVIDVLARNVIRSGAWTRNGSIVTAITAGQGLMRVPDRGGTPVAVTVLDGSRGEANHGSPMLLPDERHFLYIRNSVTPSTGVFVGDLDAKPENQSLDPVLVTDSLVSYVRSNASGTNVRDRGYLLYRRDGSLFARAFNERT